MRKLFLATLLIGAAYFVGAYWPVGKKYFAVRFAAQELAGRRLDRSQVEGAIARTLRGIEADTGIVMFRSDVTYFSGSDKRPEVKMRFTIPVRFPLIETENSHEFTLEAKASRIYGATE